MQIQVYVCALKLKEKWKTEACGVWLSVRVRELTGIWCLVLTRTESVLASLYAFWFNIRVCECVYAT